MDNSGRRSWLTWGATFLIASAGFALGYGAGVQSMAGQLLDATTKEIKTLANATDAANRRERAAILAIAAKAGHLD